MSIFHKDAVITFSYRVSTDAEYVAMAEARRDRLRYRFERRYGRPLPTYADEQRALARYQERPDKRIRVMSGEWGYGVWIGGGAG